MRPAGIKIDATLDKPLIRVDDLNRLMVRSIKSLTDIVRTGNCYFNKRLNRAQQLLVPSLL